MVEHCRGACTQVCVCVCMEVACSRCHQMPSSHHLYSRTCNVSNVQVLHNLRIHASLCITIARHTLCLPANLTLSSPLVLPLLARGECIGVLSGLHLGREVATHFAQKTFFQAAVALCDKFKLPIVLHLAGDELSFDTVVDLLREAGWLPERE